MVRIKPFKGIRPPKEYAAEVASRPYDVLNSVEAQQEATERSLLHIIKPEIDFEPIADEHSQEVYDKAVENFRAWRERGWLRQDEQECYYVYAQTMNGRAQYGLVMCCHFEDYLSGAIKKHELTRPDKEEDRMIHVRNQQANIEPVFFAYPDNAALDLIVARYTSAMPEYDFTAQLDGFRHQLWIIDNEDDGVVCGEIISIIYKGDHYQIIIRTDNYDDFVVDTQWTWNEYDRVSVKIPKEKLKVTLKQEVKKYVKD